MSALVDIVIGFIAALVSAALVHFGAADASATKSKPNAPHAEAMPHSASSKSAREATADSQSADPAVPDAAHP